MSPPQKQDRRPVISFNEGVVAVHLTKLRALTLAVAVIAPTGWAMRGTLIPESQTTIEIGVSRKEWDEHKAWAFGQVARREERFKDLETAIARVESKVDRLLLAMAAERQSHATMRAQAMPLGITAP